VLQLAIPQDLFGPRSARVSGIIALVGAANEGFTILMGDVVGYGLLLHFRD
jgi:hypothetical protein